MTVSDDVPRRHGRTIGLSVRDKWGMGGILFTCIFCNFCFHVLQFGEKVILNLECGTPSSGSRRACDIIAGCCSPYFVITVAPPFCCGKPTIAERHHYQRKVSFSWDGPCPPNLPHWSSLCCLDHAPY